MTTPKQDSPSCRALIVGYGYLARHLASILTAQGHQVWGIKRSFDKDNIDKSNIDTGNNRNITILQLDVSQPFALPQPRSHLVAGSFDYIFYMVAAGGYHDENYRIAYHAGLQHTVAALGEHLPKKLVLVSSTSAFAETDGGLITEEAPSYQGDKPQRWLVAGEEWLGQQPIPHVICRFSGIYGPERIRLITMVREGRGQLKPAHQDHWTNRIHTLDGARALWHLAQRPACTGLYTVTDSRPTRQNEVLQWLSEEIFGSGTRLPVASAEAPGRRSGNKRCTNDKLTATGFRLTYPSYQEGYRRLLGAVSED